MSALESQPDSSDFLRKLHSLTGLIPVGAFLADHFWSNSAALVGAEKYNDSNCLEEVCGSCAMLINGKARMACSALVDQLEQPIRIEPLSKFPVVRDLALDRQFMVESLKHVKAWIPMDGTYDLGEGPRMAPSEQEKGYPLSRCITCGSCLEVCPQVNEHSAFMGAVIFSQVWLFNMHPTGKLNAAERIRAAMGNGGIEDCANAQN